MIKIKKKPYGGRPLKFQCPDCDRKFHAPSHLKRHRLCHSSERPFQCHICKKGFLQAWHLGRHMTIHTGNKPFRCPECPKTFGSRFEMKTHCNYIHRGIKEHECLVCKKMFTLRSNLKVHMRKHTGEKPYECHFCLKRFGQRGHLQYHLKKHEATEQKQSVTKGKSKPNKVKERAPSDCGSEMESINSESLSPRPHQHYTLSEDTDKDTSRSFSPSPTIIHLPISRERQSSYSGSSNHTNKIPLSGRMFDHTNPREIKPFVCVSCNCGFGEISSIRAHVRHSHTKKGISNDLFLCAYCCETFTDIDTLKMHFEDCKNKASDSISSNKSGHRIEYTHNVLKRSSSAEYYEVSPKRVPPHLGSPTSPGGLSTSSDITSNRRYSYQKQPYLYEACPPGCNCRNQQKGYSLAIGDENIQSRYLSYLEKYQKMLESHVQLMEALNVYRR